MPALRNRRHELFAQRLAAGLTEAEAYVAAGYKTDNAAAVKLAARVKPRVDALKTAAKDDPLAITQDRILREYARIGFADIRRAVDWAAALVARHRGAGHRQRHRPRLTVDDDFAAAIAEIRHSGAGGLSIRLHPKLPALEALAEHLKVQRPARTLATRPEPTDESTPPLEATLSDNELKRRLAFALRRAQESANPSVIDEEKS